MSSRGLFVCACRYGCGHHVDVGLPLVAISTSEAAVTVEIHAQIEGITVTVTAVGDDALEDAYRAVRAAITARPATPPQEAQ